MAGSKSKSALRSVKKIPYGVLLKKRTLEALTKPTLLKNLVRALRTGGPVSVELRMSRGPQSGVVQARADTAPRKQEVRGQAGDAELQTQLAAARRRGRDLAGQILRSDEMMSADEFANLLGTTRMTVNVKRQKHEVLGLQGATRGFRYPRWQIDDTGRPFGALPRLFEVLGNDSWSVYRFLVQHHPELDGLTGREALGKGQVGEVLEVAQSVLRDFA
jgi:hypothetical protein